MTWARVKVVVVFGDGASSPAWVSADDHDRGDGREPDDDEPLAHRSQLAEPSPRSGTLFLSRWGYVFLRFSRR